MYKIVKTSCVSYKVTNCFWIKQNYRLQTSLCTLEEGLRDPQSNFRLVNMQDMETFEIED